jgi:UPF0755 protein
VNEPEYSEQQQRSRRHPFLKLIAVMVFLVMLGAGSAVVWIYSYSRTTGAGTSLEVVVTIPQGTSFRQITKILADAGLIQEDIRFGIIARILGLSAKIQAGEFRVNGQQQPVELLKALVNAKPVQHPITVVEGLTANEIAALFAAEKWCSESDFIALVHNEKFIKSLGLNNISSLEGYLYPDTYHLTRIPKFSAEKIIKTMVQRFFQVWNELDGDHKSMHDTVILASIVEKETGDASERARIASVFVNRLKIGMRLQSDPTVIYGIDAFNGNITRDDLQRKSPYNTYVIFGLPAGPICNPGKAALHAALHPADEKYLYFVSRNDGTHHFSVSLRDHNRAVYKYQKARKK